MMKREKKQDVSFGQALTCVYLCLRVSFFTVQPLKHHLLTPTQKIRGRPARRSTSVIRPQKTRVREERDFLSKMIQSSVIIAVTVIRFNSSSPPSAAAAQRVCVCA